MGPLRRTAWWTLLTVGSWMIHAGRWVHELGQRLDDSPKMDLGELIGGVDVKSTPFGEILMKQEWPDDKITDPGSVPCWDALVKGRGHAPN